MSNKTKGDKTRQPRGGKKLIRDQQVFEKALAGKKTQQIADEVGVSRQTVSEILNSDEVKSRIQQIDERLSNGIDDAIKTVLEAVKDDFFAARALLQNFGAMHAKVDAKHSGSLTLEQLVSASNKEEEPK